MGQSNPSVDQHMCAYWPKGSSLWTETASIKTAASRYLCPFEACGHDFAGPQTFKQHVRVSHTIVQLKKIILPKRSSGIEYVGHPRYFGNNSFNQLCMLHLNYCHFSLKKICLAVGKNLLLQFGVISYI